VAHEPAHKPSTRPGWTTFVMALAIASAVACERDADSVRAALAARESSWSRRLTTLRSEHKALEARAVARAARTQTETARLQAVVAGVRQSLADVEIQMHQIAPAVEHATVRGADAAQAALDEASARMAAYFDALTADLSAASHQLERT
jgi:hypothetical protein